MSTPASANLASVPADRRPATRAWSNLVVAWGLGLAVFALTLYRANTTNQYNDYANSYAYAEIHAFATGEPVAATDGFGPSRESSCGIFHITHHPLLAHYIAAAFEWAGMPPKLPIQLGMAIPSAALVVIVALASLAAGIGLTVAMTGFLMFAPGYYEWLSYPLTDSWAVGCYFLAALAAISRRWWWLLVVTFVMAWCSINAVVYHVAIIGGVILAAYGISLRAIAIGLGTVVAYVVAYGMHMLQVWCHFDWDFNQVWLNYFVGDGKGTSLMLRVSPMSWAERSHKGFELNAQFLAEMVRNEHGQWSYGGFWLLAIPATLWLLFLARSARNALAVLVFLFLFASTAFLVPGLLMPHLHYMPRYFLLAVLGPIMVCCVSIVRANRDAAARADRAG